MYVAAWQREISICAGTSNELKIFITLDEHGWADVNELLDGINNTGRSINMDILEKIVATDSKQRYSFNQHKTLIRANQGHSIPIDVELKEQKPPEFLYH
ncbi:MAG TPA: hypothetical protein DCZ23_07520, partial [Lachnospiraceae bacterium]|nr:hypothetical protein [Lachnospiraceae bacterium]